MKSISRIPLTIVLVVITLVACWAGCLDNHPDPSDDKSFNYVYEFSVSLPQSSNATLLLPIPVLNGTIVPFDYSNQNITGGNGSVEVTNSSHGYCLKLELHSSDNLSFQTSLTMKRSEVLDSYLSTYNHTLPNHVEYYCWVYYEGPENATLTLEYHRPYAGHGHILGPTSYQYPDVFHDLQSRWQQALVDNRLPVE